MLHAKKSHTAKKMSNVNIAKKMLNVKKTKQPGGLICISVIALCEILDWFVI